jgi:adenylosuccinate synthase
MLYNCVARWAGGNNAGHTVWVDGERFKTHLIPSGVFYGVQSVIGPGCVLHPESFWNEMSYLEKNGFDVSLVKVSPRCHIVTDEHISFDKQRLAGKLGTTGRGIAPAYSAKAARTGVLAESVLDKSVIWDEQLEGNILCEGAQGVWLDLDWGNYPYVTSSTTLPYAACSIGFPPQKIRKIFGAAKIYDTRSGEDPMFPNDLLEDEVLSSIGQVGQEYGVTTGRRRKVNWLNLDLLIKSIQITGTTNLIISKCDVLDEVGVFKLFYEGKLVEFADLKEMTDFILQNLSNECPLLREVVYSSSPEKV